MSARLIMILAILAGFFLIMAGVTFLLWQPPSSTTGSTVAMAAHLAEHQTANLLYVISVYLSGVLFLPALLMLTIRLYSKRPNAAIVAGMLFGLGYTLEMVATLASLAQWVVAVPEAAQGDPLGIKLFQTLTLQYLAVDFSGVGLVYVAAIIYAVALWRLHRAASSLLLTSTGLLVIGFATVPLFPSLSSIFIAGSILIYGLAYIALGQVAVELGRDQKT
jgi:hypothetical protein